MSVVSKEKGLEVGRHLKGKKELSEKIKKLAEAEGKKPSDIISQAIELYSTFKDIKDKKLDELLPGIIFYKSMLSDAFNYINKMNEIYASEYMKLLVSLAAQPPPVHEAVESAVARTSEQQQFIATTMSNVVNLLTNLMTSLISNITSVMAKTQTTQPLQQQPQELKSVKIE